MEDLPVFEPVKPVGKCGIPDCARDLYPGSTPNICGFRQECPMNGEAWLQYQAARRMQNVVR